MSKQFGTLDLLSIGLEVSRFKQTDRIRESFAAQRRAREARQHEDQLRRLNDVEFRWDFGDDDEVTRRPDFDWAKEGF